MQESKQSTKLVNSEIIAQLFGVTSRRVNQLANEGVISAIKEKGANKYDLLPTIKKYIKHLSDKANGRKNCGNQWDEMKQQAEAELKKSKASITRMQESELAGNMHRSEDVEAMTMDLVFSIRSMIMALPGRLAVDMANISTAAEASERIKEECHNILNDLANYRYDPEAYKRRVRDRQGWRELGEDDSSD